MSPDEERTSLGLARATDRASTMRIMVEAERTTEDELVVSCAIDRHDGRAIIGVLEVTSYAAPPPAYESCPAKKKIASYCHV